MGVRIVTGVVLIAVALLWLFVADYAIFTMGALLMYMIAAYEMGPLLKYKSRIPFVVIAAIAATLMFVAAPPGEYVEPNGAVPVYMKALVVLAVPFWLVAIYLVKSYPKVIKWHDNIALNTVFALLMLVPFLQAMGQTVNVKSSARRISLLACTMFGAALLVLQGGLTRFPAVMLSPAPAVALAGRMWPRAVWAALPVLLAGVYTTAAPLLFGLCTGRRGGRKRMVCLALAGWLCSALPFERLVGGLFPVIGWFGLAMLACRGLTGAFRLLQRGKLSGAKSAPKA